MHYTVQPRGKSSIDDNLLQLGKQGIAQKSKRCYIHTAGVSWRRALFFGPHQQSMPRRYTARKKADPAPQKKKKADPARGASRRTALEASFRNLSLANAIDQRADLAASMARLAVADAREDTAFEDALRARQARTYHDNTVYHGMGCAVCRNRLWTGTQPS